MKLDRIANFYVWNMIAKQRTVICINRWVRNQNYFGRLKKQAE